MDYCVKNIYIMMVGPRMPRYFAFHEEILEEWGKTQPHTIISPQWVARWIYENKLCIKK